MTGGRLVAVTSGKGGVGKTHVAVNLGVALAQAGHRVCVLDADLGLANVDVVLGLTLGASLADVLLGGRRLADVVVEGPAGLRVIPAANGVAELTALTEKERLRLLAELAALDAELDVLLIDTAAGISSDVLFFATVAHETLVVMTPEPTSLTDAYALMKALRARHGRTDFQVLVNRASGAAEAERAFRRLARAAERFLGVWPEYVGYLPEDDAASRAVCAQEPLVLAAPGAPASRAIRELGRRLVRRPMPATPLHARSKGGSATCSSPG